MEENCIETLLLRWYDGKLNEEETRFVENWIGESEENRRFAAQVYHICFAASAIGAEETSDAEKALAKVKGRIRAARWKKGFRRMERIAAVLIVPLVAFTAWFVIRTGSAFNSTVEIHSTTGVVSCITLPDSSRVWLNSDSHLSYPSRFGKDRRVSLIGEGYFEVAKDPKHKFIVKALAAEIEVYGTEFNVEAYNYNNIRATLVNGSIGFLFRNRSHRTQNLRMSPGQQVVYDSNSGEIALKNANVTCNTSWKDGRLVLCDTSLEDALRMIGNRFNVEFKITNRELLYNRFTGTFSNQSLDVILKYFHMSSQIDFIPQAEPGQEGRPVYEVL